MISVGEELFLEPITTRGVNSEACRITLPKSAISTLIEALEKLSPGPRDGLPRTRPGEQSRDRLPAPAHGAAAGAE